MLSAYGKLDEIPYDFIRKRLTILVSYSDSEVTKTTKIQKSVMVTKGALDNILEVCSYAEIEDGEVVELYKIKQKIQDRYEQISNRGFRILGICYRIVTNNMQNNNIIIVILIPAITKDDEVNMIS